MRLPKKLRKQIDPKALRDSDFWATPKQAFVKEFIDLLPDRRFVYGEPCFGSGALYQGLIDNGIKGYCGHMSDLYVQETDHIADIRKLDARTLVERDLSEYIDLWITNAPWNRHHLFPIIENLSKIAPVWMILPIEFIQRRNASIYMRRCSNVVPTGPLNWMPDKVNGYGYKTYAWFKFHWLPQTTILHPRNP